MTNQTEGSRSLAFPGHVYVKARNVKVNDRIFGSRVAQVHDVVTSVSKNEHAVVIYLEGCFPSSYKPDELLLVQQSAAGEPQ